MILTVSIIVSVNSNNTRKCFFLFGAKRKSLVEMGLLVFFETCSVVIVSPHFSEPLNDSSKNYNRIIGKKNLKL